MASNFKISTFISLSWIIICKSELIYGNEFLSLFIKEGSIEKNLNYNRPQLSVLSSNNFNENSNLKTENILAEPLLRGNNEESLKKDEIQHSLNNEQKLHFFQEKNSDIRENNESSTSQLDDMIISSDIGTNNGNHKLNLTTTKDNFEMSISFNISSNVDKFFNMSVGRNKSADELIHSLLQNSFNSFENNNSSDSVNEPNKDKFIIDDRETIVLESSTSIISSTADSDNSESINLDRRVNPPSFIQTNVTATASQNRQNKLLPIALQTVIYHNRGSDYNNKENNVQSESVSYNSFTQNVDALNPWKELDSLVEVRQAVNDSLHNPNFRDAIYNQQKIYSEPARTYSQPAKVYGEPSKIYSEPSKIYSEPSKIYSKPARVYSEPSKVYWPKMSTSASPTVSTTKYPNTHRVIFNLDKLPYDLLNAPKPDGKIINTDLLQNHQLANTKSSNKTFHVSSHDEQSNFDNQKQKYNPTINFRMPTELLSYHHNVLNFRNLVTTKPNNSPIVTENSDNVSGTQKSTEQNYNHQASPVQQKTITFTNTSLLVDPSTSMLSKTNDSKIGYVVEGRNYRKYRVEEKTSEGFIVGEYGVVSHTDGSLRGVRYTADSAINSSLIYDALVKFLSL